MEFNSDASLPVKCDFCTDLLERDLDPSCVKLLPGQCFILEPWGWIEGFSVF